MLWGLLSDDEPDPLYAQDLRLVDPANLDRFVLYRQGAGLGGETLASILTLSDLPGSAGMLRDFGTLSRRLKTIEERKKFLSDGRTKT